MDLLCTYNVQSPFGRYFAIYDKNYKNKDTGWPISSVPSFIRYKIYYTQTILVIIVFRDCVIRIFSMTSKDFSSLRPGTVFCIVGCIVS